MQERTELENGERIFTPRAVKLGRLMDETQAGKVWIPIDKEF